MTCKAIATFEARHDDELSFLLGDEVELCLDDAEPGRFSYGARNAHTTQRSETNHLTPDDITAWVNDPVPLFYSDRNANCALAAAEPRNTKGVSGNAQATLLIPRQLSDPDLGDAIELKHLRSPAWLRQASQPWPGSVVEATTGLVVEATTESAEEEGPQDFLGRIGAGEEGGASSKSPRTWSDEVHHRYMLGKSMKDLWVPPENIVLTSRGRKSGDVLDRFSELPLDHDELKHYYLIGKSVQEMWAHGYTTDIYCGRVAEHPSDSDSFPISLSKQVQIAEPSISRTANRELPSGRKLLPDILDVLPHVSNRTAFDASARVGGGDDMSAAQLFAPAKTRHAHASSKSSAPTTWDKVDAASPAATTFAKPAKPPTFISASFKRSDGVLRHRSAVSEDTAQRIGDREPFVPNASDCTLRVYY